MTWCSVSHHSAEHDTPLVIVKEVIVDVLAPKQSEVSVSSPRLIALCGDHHHCQCCHRRHPRHHPHCSRWQCRRTSWQPPSRPSFAFNSSHTTHEPQDYSSRWLFNEMNSHLISFYRQTRKLCRVWRLSAVTQSATLETRKWREKLAFAKIHSCIGQKIKEKFVRNAVVICP